MPAEILIALVFRFRLITEAQAALLARLMLEETRAVIRKLSRTGWIELATILVRPPAPLAGPLATWAPGQPPIPYSSLSQQLLSRSGQSSPSDRTVLFATRKTARTFGGIAPSRSRVFQFGHDLQLVEAFLRIRETDPERAESWIGEECWRRERRVSGFVPDAMTMSRGVPTAVECGGAYSQKRLKKIHSSCRALRLPYEIW